MTHSVKGHAARVAALLLTLSASALVLVGCQTPPPPPPPVAEAPPPPPTPPITLPSRIVDAASAYSAYVDHVSAISPAFKDGESVAASLRLGESYEAEHLQRGMTAYAAIVALQDPTFVATVRGFAADPTQRGQIATSIMRDPNYVLGFRGSDSAAGLIIAAFDSQGQGVLEAGRKVKQAAYDVQHQSWSKAEVSNREARLALAKNLSTAELAATMEQTQRLRQAATGAPTLSVSGPPAPPPYTTTVVRALALAAMAALGDGSEDFNDPLMGLLSDPGQLDCLSTSKSYLYECLAVSKPHYEDVFCLGQHAMIDTGQCIIKAVTPRVIVAKESVLPVVAVADQPPTPKKKRKKKHVAQ
jgi:hypothetical protein